MVRLRPLHMPDDVDAAVPWYRDPVVLAGSENRAPPFSRERVERMYQYLSGHGSVFIIEVLDTGGWRPVGDVTLSDTMMPIVIGDPAWRGRGVGLEVLRQVEDLAKERGMTQLIAHKIDESNVASQRLFQRAGFERTHLVDDGAEPPYAVWIKNL